MTNCAQFMIIVISEHLNRSNRHCARTNMSIDVACLNVVPHFVRFIHLTFNISFESVLLSQANKQASQVNHNNLQWWMQYRTSSNVIGQWPRSKHRRRPTLFVFVCVVVVVVLHPGRVLYFTMWSTHTHKLSFGIKFYVCACVCSS